MTVILNLRGKRKDPIYHVKNVWRQNGKLYIQRNDSGLFDKANVFEFGKDFTYVEMYWEPDDFYEK